MKPDIYIGIIVLCLLSLVSACDDPRLNFDRTIIPADPQNMGEINSIYDDYNSNLSKTFSYWDSWIVFSTNRRSQGGDFDLVSYECSIMGDLVNAEFEFYAYGDQKSILGFSLDEINTPYNELGPYAFSEEVWESWNDPQAQTGGAGRIERHRRLFYASDSNGHFDIHCCYYHEYTLDDIVLSGHNTLGTINSAFDDYYPSILYDTAGNETLYFTSDRNGDFDIFMAEGHDSNLIELATQVSIALVPELSGAGNDKCPYIYGDVMVFASDRQGGYGGFDLYYSLFDGTGWSDPANFGPDINTGYNEYRPVYHAMPDEEFFNDLLIFSSDRPGGLGGYDLYLAGISLPDTM